jgi:hypothetical protein
MNNVKPRTEAACRISFPDILNRVPGLQALLGVIFIKKE